VPSLLKRAALAVGEARRAAVPEAREREVALARTLLKRVQTVSPDNPAAQALLDALDAAP
jgi:hypothetical protein